MLTRSCTPLYSVTSGTKGELPLSSGVPGSLRWSPPRLVAERPFPKLGTCHSLPLDPDPCLGVAVSPPPTVKMAASSPQAGRKLASRSPDWLKSSRRPVCTVPQPQAPLAVGSPAIIELVATPDLCSICQIERGRTLPPSHFLSACCWSPSPYSGCRHFPCI